MPSVRANGVELSYIERGAGEAAIVFSHSFLLDHRHFEPQIGALESRYRVIAYDHRDHGSSGRASRPYDIEVLVDDAIAVIEHTGAGPCHFVGLSSGGFVGMRIALRRPELLLSLTLMDTSATAEPLRKRVEYELLFAAARVIGIRPMVGIAMRKLFGPEFRHDPQHAGAAARWRAHIAQCDRDALIRFGHAIFGRNDVLPRLAGVDVPTLVMVGAEDVAQPPAQARRVAARIPHAKLVIVPRAGHIITEEAPDFVTRELAAFLDRVGPGARDRTPRRSAPSSA